VIYLDSSVALAHLLKEERSPPPSFWEDSHVSSRLLEYEVWNRIHAYGLGRSHTDEVRAILARLSFIELTQPVLARALESFPIKIRTLDALHLASIVFIRRSQPTLQLASYDARLIAAARALEISVLPL
jgi:hypothetical protein